MDTSPTIRDIPFRDLPHQPSLFLRYVDGSSEASGLYQSRPTYPALEAAATHARGQSFPRQEMAEILSFQNERFGNSDGAFRAIEDLAKPDSVAILTGQQAGLFTGPALTVYKALTALRLSAELRGRGFNAVPIFWIASDDHDLEEVTRLAMPGPDAEIHVTDCRENLFGRKELPARPVGAVQCPDATGQLIDDYFAFLPNDGNAECKAGVARAYRPGNSFAEAFGCLMAQLFPNRGLVLFDPRHPGAKKLAAGVIRQAVTAAHTLRSRLAERTAILKQLGLAPQVAVLPCSTLVFLEDKGERRLLLTAGHDFLLKETDRRFSSGELLELAAAEPERFSPNVLLRPVVQDQLFPSAAYVGGPAEVAYLAQVEPLYQFFGRTMPVVWPRSSFTVLGRRDMEIMRSHGLSLQDCFKDKDEVIRHLLRAKPAPCEVGLEGMKRQIEQSLVEIRPSLLSAETSLARAADTVRRKLLHRIRSLETKFVHLEARRDSTLHRAAVRLLNGVYPSGQLQERVLGIHALLSVWGPGLLDILYDAVDPLVYKHHILQV